MSITGISDINAAGDIDSMDFARELIYQAAYDDEIFEQLPALISRHVGARSCTLHWRDSGQSREIFGHSRHFSDQDLANYAQHFADSDLWTMAGLRLPNRAWLCSELVDERDYLNSSFYNDWIRAIGDDTYWCMGAVMDTLSGFGIVGLHRGETQGDFASDDARKLADIMPDLQRMFATRIRLSKAETRSRTLEHVIAALPDALFLVDGAGRMLMANAAADEVLREGALICGMGGRLQFGGHSQERLEELVSRASGQGTGAETRVQDAGGIWHAVSIVPAPAENGANFFLVTVRRPGGSKGAEAVAASLMQTHGLSRSEAQVAVLLADGHTPQEISETRRVSVSTVRNQVKSILWKTGLRRQSQIVALVARLRS